jgi:hypothetical protein
MTEHSAGLVAALEKNATAKKSFETMCYIPKRQQVRALELIIFAIIKMAP